MAAHFKIIAGVVLSLVFTVLVVGAGYSYVLQGPHIIRLMTEKLGQARSLSVSQRVIFYRIPPQAQESPELHIGEELKTKAEQTDEERAKPDANEMFQPAHSRHQKDPGDVDPSADVGVSESGGPVQTDPAPEMLETIQLDESLKYVFPGMFRSDIVSESNQRIYVFNQGRSITVIDGVISETGESQFDAYKEVLLHRSRDMLSERLVDLGVDISVSSLGRFNGRPALVIGAEFPDETVPQVWVDKDTFHPLRIIVFGAGTPYSIPADFLEIRYSNWQQIGKISYPMRVEFFQDGATVRVIEVKDFQINPNVPEYLFDIARLKSEYRQPVMTAPREGETGGLSEVQKTIEEFKKIFE